MNYNLTQMMLLAVEYRPAAMARLAMRMDRADLIPMLHEVTCMRIEAARSAVLPDEYDNSITHETMGAHLATISQVLIGTLTDMLKLTDSEVF